MTIQKISFAKPNRGTNINKLKSFSKTKKTNNTNSIYKVKSNSFKFSNQNKNIVERSTNNILDPNKTLIERFKEAKNYGKEVAVKNKSLGISLKDGLTPLKNQEKLSIIQDQFPTKFSDIIDTLIKENSSSLNMKEEAVKTLGLDKNFLQGEGKNEILLYGVQKILKKTGIEEALGSILDKAKKNIETTPLMSKIDPIVGTISSAISFLDIIDNWGKNSLEGGLTKGVSSGAYLGTMIYPGIGTAIGAAIGGLIGGLSSTGLFGSGKHKDQKVRDGIRDNLKEINFIDKDYKLKLADGSLYDIGLDGGHKYTNMDGTKRHAYDVDFSNPLASEIIGLAQPLAAILTNDNSKKKDDLCGYLVNAALSNANTLEEAVKNIEAFYIQAGLDSEQAVEAIGILTGDGTISESDGLAYAFGIKTLNDMCLNNQDNQEKFLKEAS